MFSCPKQFVIDLVTHAHAKVRCSTCTLYGCIVWNHSTDNNYGDTSTPIFLARFQLGASPFYSTGCVKLIYIYMCSCVCVSVCVECWFQHVCIVRSGVCECGCLREMCATYGPDRTEIGGHKGDNDAYMKNVCRCVESLSVFIEACAHECAHECLMMRFVAKKGRPYGAEQQT